MNFKQAISSYKRTWVIGQCLRTLLWLAAIFVIALIFYGLADSIWALSNDARSLLNKCLIAAVSIAVVVVIYRAFKTTRSELSAIADAAISNDSKSIRAAHDLTNQKSISPLNDYLSLQAQDKAVKDLGNIPLKKTISFKAIGVSLLALLAVAGIGYGIRAIHPEKYDTVSQRMLHPDQDIPPYSPLKFIVTQDSNNTVYGGENQVRVEIKGGELEHDVVCKVRNKRSGKIDTISTFQESASTFSKKFSNILTDVEYSFSCGNARSEWKTINVLMQPKFTTATVKITPPSYTMRKATEFPLEGNEISVINGSTVELTITSNRPLSGGEILLKTETLTEHKEETVEAVTAPNDPKQVTFRWIAANTSHVSCVIKDVRDTASAAPLDFNILTRADLAPVAELTSPARLVLATPSSKIPIKGNVEDDYEVDSVYLVRTLVGFRDRASQLAASVSKESYNFGKELDLKQIGVEANQVLEFYLEANDRNPSLLGIGTSDVVRVQIISEDEYAQRLRDKAIIEQFSIRYRVLANATRDAVESLNNLKEANNKNDGKLLGEMRDTSRKTHRNSRAIALRISEDFIAFDSEGKLTERALELAEKFLTNYDQLLNVEIENGVQRNENEILDMLNRLEKLQEEVEKLEQQAIDDEKWGLVAKQAAIFGKLYRNQLSIASRITNIAKEIQKGMKRNAQQIKSLGETQQKNKQQLLKFAKDLKKAAAELGADDGDLQGDCEVWLDKLEELNIPDPMDACTLSTQVGKSHDASTHAYLAHSLMKQLVEMENNKFAALIRNDPPKKPTRKEMLEALHNQNKGGNGPGGGGGAGGGAGNGGKGGRMRNNRNTPMFGPGRSNFGRSGQGLGMGAGQGQGKGNGKGRTPKLSANNSIESSKKRDTKTSQATRTNVPSKYKDAVKRFYSEQQK